MYDQKKVVVEIKNKLDDDGSDGIDLYDNSKNRKKRIQANFFTIP